MAAVLRASLDPARLTAYVTHLVENHVPDDRAVRIEQVDVDRALERIEHSFSHVVRKYYAHEGVVGFDHLNSDHMAAFLYLLGNAIWARTGETAVPTKLFLVNKAMNGLDLFFSVALPDVFLLVHPVGSVIGAAHYEDFLVVYQNCTIGSDKGAYPRFAGGAILYARSTVIGDCAVGRDVVFAAGSTIVNADVPDATIVTGQFPDQVFRPNRVPVRARLFDGG